jgi:hypothetical protein
VPAATTFVSYAHTDDEFFTNDPDELVVIDATR